jgi:fructose-1,6-bisphosphatase/inositol monophosphatase family enzyme
MNLTLIEKDALDVFRGEGSSVHRFAPPHSPDAWLHFGLVILFKIGSMIRKERLSPMATHAHFKSDGSPVTKTDQAVEDFVRNELVQFCPDAALVGEESGGRLPDTGPAMAIDPIDGTWAFLNRSETIATSLMIFHDKKPSLGMVFNPVSGELGYGGNNFKARLMQISIFNEGDQGLDLPLECNVSKSILVNLHPQRQAGAIMKSFYKMWRNRRIGMVRSTGGSPSLALLDVAKGCFGYVNLWGKNPAAPYDLAAGISLVRSAGGEVLDIHGKPAQLLNHEGPFVGAINPQTATSLLLTLQKSHSPAPGNNIQPDGVDND